MVDMLLMVSLPYNSTKKFDKTVKRLCKSKKKICIPSKYSVKNSFFLKKNLCY